MSTDTEFKAQRDAAENALRAVDFWLDELGCGYAVEGSTLKPSDVAEAVAQAVSTLRKKLAEERAAHLATRQELSMALAERAHARAEVERLRADVETLARRDANYWTKHCNAERAVERLRAEVRDLKARLEVAKRWHDGKYRMDDEHFLKLVSAALDLRRKDWKKP